MREPRAARYYEMMVIVTPEITDEEFGGALERLTGLIGTNGGSVVHVYRESPWGRRRLAYAIRTAGRDVRDGYYALFHLQLDPNRVVDLERDLRLEDQVMRYLMTVYEGVPTAPEPPAPEAEAPAEGEPTAEAQAATAGADAGDADVAAAAAVTAPVATIDESDTAAEDSDTDEPVTAAEPVEVAAVDESVAPEPVELPVADEQPPVEATAVEVPTDPTAVAPAAGDEVADEVTTSQKTEV